MISYDGATNTRESYGWITVECAPGPLLLLGTGCLERVTPPVHHDGSQERDDRLALLVVACGFHRHDADVWPRARPALLCDLASGVDRIPLEDGRGEPDLIPPEVGEDILGDIRYALAGHQGDGEGRVDQRTAVLGLGGVGVVHVDRGRVLRKEGKPQVVCGRHCAPQWMIVDVTHLEVLEKASPPPLFDRHATPLNSGYGKVDSVVIVSQIGPQCHPVPASYRS